MMMVMTRSHHIAIESTRDIAASCVHRNHLDHTFCLCISCDIHDNNNDEDDEVNDDDGNADDDDVNLGASSTAMAHVNAPVLDVAFCLLGKFHHLKNCLDPRAGMYQDETTLQSKAREENNAIYAVVDTR